MSDPIFRLNENFLYNSMLVRSLLQFVSVNERTILQIWLEKMHRMDESVEELHIRHEYMWFLLLQLRNKRITEPFNKYPETDKLLPLKDILPYHIYEEVLTSTQENMSWLEKAGEDITTKEAQLEIPSSPPATFLENQPVPKNGVICYIAAFSDQDY